MISASSLCLGACGNSNNDTFPQNGSQALAGGIATTATSNTTTSKNDRDNDGDHNDDDEKVLYFGHRANMDDRRISVALVRRYFAAAASEDGAEACPLLAPFIAESVAERDGHAAPLRGKTCAGVMSKLFKLHHQLLTEKNATLKIMAIRVEGTRALAVLEFSTIPEVRQLTERRVGNTWKLITILDGILE